MDAPIGSSGEWAAQRAQDKRDALLRLRRKEWAALAVALVLTLLAYINVKRVEVSGISMEPTFTSGDAIFVWKTVPLDSLKPGDIIVFRSTDGDELIKRIVFIADPHDPAQFPPVGFPRIVRTIDGTPMTDDIAFGPYFGAVNVGTRPQPPPQNMIYVMGDNAMHSNDSRDFGPVAPGQLLGKVLGK